MSEFQGKKNYYFFNQRHNRVRNYFAMPIQAPQWTDFLSCPICMYEFATNLRQPISLACGHTICRTCLATLHRNQCPFDQTTITKDLDNLPINYALLQLVTSSVPSSSSSVQNNGSNNSNVNNNISNQDADLQSASVQNLNSDDLQCYKLAKKCIEELALYLKPYPNGNVGLLSRPMQRKLVTLVNCQLMEDEGRSRSLRAARSLGERTVTELILQHQNPQQLSTNLWAAVRARGCQFLGPGMQEEVLKLVLLTLEDGSALSRKVLVMFVVQRLETQFSQASKTSIGHVVQLLYRASCFKVSKREGDSSLMQLKEEFRTYDALRREHDAQIVQIATEAGLRIAPDQWSALLYGDSNHKSHMQSIIDKLQTPQSFAQSVQELVIALQRTGDPAKLSGLRVHLKLLAGIDSSENTVPSWQECATALEAVKQVVNGLVDFIQHHGNRKLQEPTHILHNSKYKISFCRDLSLRRSCPRGPNCTFAHSEEELETYRFLRKRYPRQKDYDAAVGGSGNPEEVSPRFQPKPHQFRFPSGPVAGPAEKSPHHLHVPIKSPYSSSSPVLTNPNSPNPQHPGNTRFTYNGHYTSPPPIFGNGNMNRNFLPPPPPPPPQMCSNNSNIPPPSTSMYPAVPPPEMFKNFHPNMMVVPPHQIPSNGNHNINQSPSAVMYPSEGRKDQPSEFPDKSSDLNMMNPYINWKDQISPKPLNDSRAPLGPPPITSQANKFFDQMAGRPSEIMKFEKQRRIMQQPPPALPPSAAPPTTQSGQPIYGIKEEPVDLDQTLWHNFKQPAMGPSTSALINTPTVPSSLYHIDTTHNTAKDNFIRSDSILQSQTDDDFPFENVSNNKFGPIGNIPMINQTNYAQSETSLKATANWNMQQKLRTKSFDNASNSKFLSDQLPNTTDFLKQHMDSQLYQAYHLKDQLSLKDSTAIDLGVQSTATPHDKLKLQAHQPKNINNLTNNLYNLSIKNTKIPLSSTSNLDNFAIAAKASVTIPSQIIVPPTTTTTITTISQTTSGTPLATMWNNEFHDTNKFWSNGKTTKTSDDNYDDSLSNGIRERELLNLIDDN